MTRARRAKMTYFICAIPIALAIVFYLTRPFADVIGEAHGKTSALSQKQMINIRLAAKKVNGHIVKPGETFSFNHVVGPRTYQRGFVNAPAYVDDTTAMSEGGGICLVSSLVYQAALHGGLTVLERVPHTKTTATVEPGLDATVWYGRHDLKFRNDGSQPVMIKCHNRRGQLDVELLGNLDAPKAHLLKTVDHSADGHVAVTIMRRSGDKVTTVSRDLYRRHDVPEQHITGAVTPSSASFNKPPRANKANGSGVTPN